MTLLNAPVYDERKEKRQRYLLIGSGATIVLLVLITLLGFLLGHGWAFSNLPAEHRVDTFFAALQARDYEKAFAIYYNDPDWKQHPDKYKGYPESRFQEDWATQPPINGPLKSYHVDISKTDGEGTFGSGIIVAVTVNGATGNGSTVNGSEGKPKRVFMYYIRKTGELSWPAFHELQY